MVAKSTGRLGGRGIVCKDPLELLLPAIMPGTDPKYPKGREQSLRIEINILDEDNHETNDWMPVQFYGANADKFAHEVSAGDVVEVAGYWKKNKSFPAYCNKAVYQLVKK